MSIRIIINADDLGLSPEVNKEIDKAMECGYITSTTILANTEYIEDVKKIIKKHPKASFGIHLNLTQGKAITNSGILRESGIVDKDNCFTGDARYITLFTHDILNAIQEEWIAQIMRLSDNGISISHIDGHHHIHSKFELQCVLLEICKHFGIKKIRNRYSKPFSWKFCKKTPTQTHEVKNHTKTNNIAQTTPKRSNPKTSPIKYLLNSIKWYIRIKISGYKTTQYFDSYASCINNLSSGKKYPKNCTIELMCHPAHLNYIEEYNDICNRKVDNLIHDCKYISYNEL